MTIVGFLFALALWAIILAVAQPWRAFVARRATGNEADAPTMQSAQAAAPLPPGHTMQSAPELTYGSGSVGSSHMEPKVRIHTFMTETPRSSCTVCWFKPCGSCASL